VKAKTHYMGHPIVWTAGPFIVLRLSDVNWSVYRVYVQIGGRYSRVLTRGSTLDAITAEVFNLMRDIRDTMEGLEG
jgi:hypothetical protein